MTDAVEITGRDDLEAWLQGRTQEVAVTIATRAALRVAPLFWDWRAQPSRKADMTDLVVCRRLLVSGVAAKASTPEIRAAAAATATVGIAAATFADDSDAAATASATAVSAAAITTISADYVAAATAAVGYGYGYNYGYGYGYGAVPTMLQEFSRDCTAIEAGADVLRTSLWAAGHPPEDFPDPLPHHAWRERGEGWAFWADWYQGYLDGAPLAPGLLTEIALIEPEDWDRGDAHVNGMIAGVYDGYRKRASGAAADRAIAETPERAMARNATIIRMQIDTLLELAEVEIQRLRGQNDFSDAARAEVATQITILTRIVESARQMCAALEDGSRQGAGVLVVIKEALPVVVEDAENLARHEEEPQVSEAIIYMAAVVKRLTESGTPGTVAAGVGILETLRISVAQWWARKRPPKA